LSERVTSPLSKQSRDTSEADSFGALPSLPTLIALAVGFRLTVLFLNRYGGIAPEFTDFAYYHDLARLSAQGYYPGVHFWTEYPPILPWLAVAAYRLTVTWPAWTQPFFWFDLTLTVIMAAADAGSIVAIDRLGNALWGAGRGRRATVLYAALYSPAYAVLGWFDPLATFFLLAALATLVAPLQAWDQLGRRTLRARAFGLVAAGLLVGTGVMVKLFPIVALPAALVSNGWPASATGFGSGSRLIRKVLPGFALAVVGAVSAIGALAAPFLLLSPATFLATFRNILARGSWESPWALLDGYYGTGGVAALSDRLFFNDSASWGQPVHDPAIWWVALAVCTVLYLDRLRVAVRLGTARAAIALTGFGLTLLLLLSRGFSQQLVLWILPFVVLIMPGFNGAALAVLLTLDTIVLEGYFYVTLFPSLHRLLWVTVTIRTALLLWFALECASAIDPKQWTSYLVLRRRFAGPIATLAGIAVLLAGLLFGPMVVAEASVKFGTAPLANALASLPPATVIVFTQPDAYDRLASSLDVHPAVVVGEPRLLTWTGSRSLYWRLDQSLGTASDATLVIDSGQPSSGPLAEAVNRWLAARYGDPIRRDVGAVHLAEYSISRRPSEKALDLTFGDGIRLVGFSPEKVTASTGAPLQVTLHWTTSASTTTDYSVSTQLLDASGHLVAQRDGMPVDNTMPTSTWHPGETIDDPVEIDVPKSAAPGGYQIIVVVYDHRSLARLPARGASSQGDHGLLTNVMIQP
jgi:hypothetical protein